MCPMVMGMGSPRRRLKSRAARAGLMRASRSAESPTSTSPFSRMKTTDGIWATWVPRVSAAAEFSRATEAAVKHVPRSMPSAYALICSDPSPRFLLLPGVI